MCICSEVQTSSRLSVLEGSDKIKAFISTEVSVHKLFTGWRDLQYTPADLAKDPLPLHLIIYSSHLPLCFHLHTQSTSTQKIPRIAKGIPFCFFSPSTVLTFYMISFLNFHLYCATGTGYVVNGKVALLKSDLLLRSCICLALVAQCALG